MIDCRKALGPLTMLLASALTVSACGPQGSPQASSGDSSQIPRPPKVLTIAVRGEPSDLGSFTATSGSRGSDNVMPIVHNSLAQEDEREALQPQLAQAVPSTADGSWRINADGSMEATWRLRPNVKWQDGVPFTSADLLFSFEVYTSRDIPSKTKGQKELIDSVQAPDPQTLVVRWSAPYFRANRGEELLPLPRHLLEDLYRRDKAAFADSRYFTTDFIGLGPYRMTHWELGSSIDFEPFADYYQGRPPLDRVIIKFIPDPNTIVANILAGAVDVVLPPSIDIDALVEIQGRWAGTRNVARAEPTGRFRYVEPQHRPEFEQPAHSTTNPTVRQALYTAIDRQTMAEVVTHGIAPVADSWIRPGHTLRPAVESAIPQYPYDPARAQALLAQAGWTLRQDGVRVNSDTGNRMQLRLTVELPSGASGGREREANIIRDNWQAVGVQVDLDIVPPTRGRNRENEAKAPGLNLSGNLPNENWYTKRLSSREIASAQTNWVGTNKEGYYNPDVDAVLDGIRGAIDPRDQVDLHRRLLQLAMSDVPVMPLYWEHAPVLLREGVKGPIGVLTRYRFQDWDIE